MAKKSVYRPEPFESRYTKDKSANLHRSLLTSDAYKRLSPRAAKLYTYCKLQYFAEYKKPIADDRRTFTFPQSLWLKYELYSENNKRLFYKDMRELIELGFVDLVESGKNTRTANIYKFSARWLNYVSKKE